MLKLRLSNLFESKCSIPQSIVHLPSHISMTEAVVTFFRPVPDDLMFVEPERLVIQPTNFIDTLEQHEASWLTKSGHG